MSSPHSITINDMKGIVQEVSNRKNEIWGNVKWQYAR